MDEIYEIILAKLDEIVELKWIDLDKGQLETADSRPPVLFPCALISIQYPNTEDLDYKGTSQDCNVQIGIRVANDYTGNTSAVTPDAERAKSLEYLKLVQKVYKKLQGYTDASLNQLSRRSQREERRGDQIKVMQINFVSQFEDVSLTS